MDSVIRRECGEILALEPLTKENVEKLVEGMTGDSRLKSSAGIMDIQKLRRQSLFLEEVLKHLVGAEASAPRIRQMEVC